MSGVVGLIAGALTFSLMEGRWRWPVTIVVAVVAGLVAYEILNA